MTRTPDDEELERLAKAATQGDRRQGSIEKYHVFVRDDQALAGERVLLRMNEHYPHEADAAYIAAANPTAILRLLERLRAAEALASVAADYYDSLDVDRLDPEYFGPGAPGCGLRRLRDAVRALREKLAP